MFQFPSFTMESRVLIRLGFPIQRPPGRGLFGSSPGFFAAFRVFHRLPTPGHSPCALFKLDPTVIQRVQGHFTFPSHYLLVKELSSFLLLVFKSAWWAQVDLNYRPHAYQACALTT